MTTLGCVIGLNHIFDDTILSNGDTLINFVSNKLLPGNRLQLANTHGATSI
jgi:hypothetical protein